jgi:Domain of unknown function (DU1801)
MKPEIKAFNQKQSEDDQSICELLAMTIDKGLDEEQSKIWHAHPVWFLDGNPIVGYSRQKAGIRLMFWSGASFDEEQLNVVGKKFKDASIFYTSVKQVNLKDLKRWLKKSRQRKGRLELLP